MEEQQRIKGMFDRSEATYLFKSKPGLSKEIVELIYKDKNEPEWMLQKRLRAFEIFSEMPIPNWGPSLEKLHLDELTYYAKPDAKKNSKKWEDLPEGIRSTFEKLGLPEAEKKSLGGVGAQWESQVVYHNLKKDLEDKGVIFCDMDVAVQEHPELVQKYFMKCVPVNLHKFAALHGAVWSGGSFIYVPKNVKVDLPLQAYFRVNEEKMGQFEHTLIIADEGAEVSYIEGCSSPLYSLGTTLHAGCVELFVHKNARIRYTSVESWAKDVFNLNTKRAIVYDNGTVEWINGNTGCLPGETRVYSNPEGPLRIDEIKLGDYVYSFDLNNLTPVKAMVKATKCSGLKKIYEIVTDNFRTIRASDNHPFLTVDRSNKNLSWKMLRHLRYNDLICTLNLLPDNGKLFDLPKIEKYGKNIINIPDKTDEEFMWLLGVYLGDGYISKEVKSRKSNEKVDRRVYFAVPETDKIRKKLESVIKKVLKSKTTKKGICLTINSVMFCNLIRELGFSGGALSKRVPKFIFGLPLNQKLAFIEGYLDSDGHVRKNMKRKNIVVGGTFTSSNKPLLEDIKSLMIMCGLNPGKVLTYKRKTPSKTSKGDREYYNHAVNISGEDVESIRKKSIKEKDYARFSRIKSINYIGESMTYDIEVEDHHNFIANGVLVHNSGVTMLYPSSMLVGKNSKSDYLGIAFAGKDQNQDTGCKVYHLAPNTSSTVKAKSISKDGGITTYRGVLKINKGATNSKSNVQCDALMMDNISKSNTIPNIEVNDDTADVGHEATVGKISGDQIFYLMSRGLTQEEATKLIVSGFIEPIIRELPIEYAVELNRLIELEIEGSLG